MLGRAVLCVLHYASQSRDSMHTTMRAHRLTRIVSVYMLPVCRTISNGHSVLLLTACAVLAYPCMPPLLPASMPSRCSLCKNNRNLCGFACTLRGRPRLRQLSPSTRIVLMTGNCCFCQSAHVKQDNSIERYNSYILEGSCNMTFRLRSGQKVLPSVLSCRAP